MIAWRRLRPALAALAFVGLSAALGGCVTLPRAAYTAAEERHASPPGFQNVRYAEDDPALVEMLSKRLMTDAHGEVNLLAISGGGANAAYGAGLLYGWSKTGQRPEFQLVTGISAGALTAPLIFLGPRWDGVLRQAIMEDAIQHVLKEPRLSQPLNARVL